jgi:hypothetical protein
MTDEDRQIMRAVERFAGTVTVPVLHEHKPDQVDQIGTGTLFDVEGRLLFVTAGHIFDEINPQDMVIPSTKTKELHGIGPYELFRPDIEDIDIAVIELKHAPAIERARDGWRVLSLADTAEPSEEGHFILAGYPSERGTRVGGLLGGSLLTLHTERLAQLPRSVVTSASSDLDLFFRYEQEAETIDGKTMAVPKLPGCSGASMWEYREPPDMRFWNAEQCLHIVGVQSSYFDKKGYFRVKRWSYVRAMIDKLLIR